MRARARRPFAAPLLPAPLLLVLGTAGAAPAAMPQQSTHGVLRAVPVPRDAGAVRIDGALDEGEWDTSARMHVYNAKKIRRRYSVDIHAMWDAGALYLGMRFRDPTPMVNNVDAEGAPFDGWQADAFQARFTTDYGQIHFDAWYSSKKDMTVGAISYDRPLNTENSRVFRGAGTAVRDPSGFELAFRRDADNRGYCQEIRIPWKMLYRQVPGIAGGLRLRFTGEYFWGGPTGIKWPAVLWSDPINPENPVRIVVYQSPHVWGTLELLAEGRVAPEELDEDDEGLRLEGPIPIRLELPAGATRFTLAIDDTEGRRVRNLASHAEVKQYQVDAPGGGRVVEVPWDGRAEGGWDKDRSVFVGDFVRPGEYVVRALVHSGVGVVHAGSFYNPGTPPWPTADGSGSWLSDHAPPHAVAAMPRASETKGRVFLIARLAESGVAFIGLDERGRKIWEWVRQTAEIFEVAGGEKHAYFAFTYVGKPYLGRLDPATGVQAKFSAGVQDVPLPGEATGLAVGGGRCAVAVKGAGILVLDAESGERVGAVGVEPATHLAFAPDGRLVGLSGGEAFAAKIDTGEVERFRPAGVERPTALACDEDGRLYVSDSADATVKVLDRAAAGARPVATVGRPGGRRPGRFDPRRMAAPGSLAIETRPDGARRLWCVEQSYDLRRVAVWDVGDPRAPGLLRDYVGGTCYMGSGGLLSDDSPDIGIYRGVIYEIDYENYDFRPLEVMGGRPDPVPGKVALFAPGEFSYGAYFGNGCYFTSGASGRAVEYYVEAGNLPTVYVRRSGRWHCVAALGHRDSGVRFPEGFPQPGGANTVFAWSDLDGDGWQSPDEVAWADVGERDAFRHRGWGYRPGRDLAWYHSGIAVRPVRFAADGAPVYDLARAERLPGELGRRGHSGDVYRTRFGYVIQAPKPGYKDPHGTIHGLVQLEGYDEAGRLRWTYPSYWNSVHGAFTAPMAIPGVIMGALKVSGIVRMEGYDIVALRGNTGQEFLVRDDGLYVGELFTDQRMAPSPLPPEERIAGVPINDTSLGGEPFSGWIARQSDGKVRMTYGQNDVRIAEVTGLGSVRVLADLRFFVTEGDLAKARAFRPRAAAARETECRVPRGGPFDPGAVQFGEGALSIRAGREEVARARVRYDDTGLHVAWQVFDLTPFVNRGRAAATAFKSGDSVSLFVAPDRAWAADELGGTRVLMTDLAGEPTAVVYRPAGPGDASFVFKSPVREREFRYVGVEPSVKFGARRAAQECVVAATVPWEVLGVRPRPGLRMRGDLGVIFGRETTNYVERIVRWVDTRTNVVNDVPTEAEFFPARWGAFVLE